MQKWLLILTILLAAITIAENGLSATYNATGIWEYVTSNPWSSDPLDCPASTGTGLTAINQNKDTFTYTDQWGIYPGRVSGANYTATSSFPEDYGMTTTTIDVDLTSDTAGTGLISWQWTDGFYSCWGGSDVTITKQPAVTTFDAPVSGTTQPPMSGTIAATQSSPRQIP
jgi:hypothetical protein